MRKKVICILFSLFFIACGRVEQKQNEIIVLTVEAGEKEEGEWINVETPEAGNVIPSEQGNAMVEGSLAEGFGHKLENMEKKGQDSPYYSNLEENLGIGFSMNPVLVCPDPVYGITYLVNSGRDYRIYALRDGKAELAVELPAKELLCRNGELYFIVDDYGRFKLTGVKKGDIVKYQPVTGNVELLVSDEAYDMRVYPDCILYEQMVTEKDDEGIEGFRFIPKSYTFANGEIAEIDSTIDRWENLTLRLDSVFDEEKGRYYDDFQFVDENGIERMRWGMKSSIPMDLYGTEGRICGDVLYLICRKERKLYACNMKTGEMEAVSETLLPPTVVMTYDYIYFKDRFIFTDGFSVKKREKTGTVLFRHDKYDVLRQDDLDALFTDGTELYGLLKNKLYRLEFMQWNRETQEVPEGWIWNMGSKNEFEANTDEYYLVLRDPF